jgi:acyl-CoA reductase-like NAD-dependent aldehyde dehydrogenase
VIVASIKSTSTTSSPRVEPGVAKINEKTTGLELHVPFGGLKDSSTNTYREQGDAGIDFYTQIKTVSLNTRTDSGLAPGSTRIVYYRTGLCSVRSRMR